MNLDGAHLPHLLNLSTRGKVDVGEGVMIAGTIIGGSGSQTLVLGEVWVLHLARGPGAIDNPLPDPALTLVDPNGATIFANDNWQDSQGSQIAAGWPRFIQPARSRDSRHAAPGNYTALLSDTHGGQDRLARDSLKRGR